MEIRTIIYGELAEWEYERMLGVLLMFYAMLFAQVCWFVKTDWI